MSTEILYMKSENIGYTIKMKNDMIFIEKYRKEEEELKIPQVGKKHSKWNCIYGVTTKLLKTNIKQIFGFKNRLF